MSFRGAEYEPKRKRRYEDFRGIRERGSHPGFVPNDEVGEWLWACKTFEEFAGPCEAGWVWEKLAHFIGTERTEESAQAVDTIIETILTEKPRNP